MVIRVVTPDFVPERSERPVCKELVTMFENLLSMAKDGVITGAACAFLDDTGGNGGTFGPTTASVKAATSLLGALATLQFQMHMSSSAETHIQP